MEFLIYLPELGNNDLKLVTSNFTGKSKIIFNNHEVPKINDRFSINNNFEKPILITLHRNNIDPVPKVLVNNVEIKVVEPLKWYDYIWMGLPILLVFQGGLLGVLFGFIAIRLNSLVFRNNNNLFLKYLLTLGINVSITAFYFSVALVLKNMIGK